MKIEKCPISGSSESVKFLYLGNIPIEGQLCDTREESLNATRYPMLLQYFPKSKLVTLNEYVDPDKIYENYLYHSGISKPYIDHCGEMFDYINKHMLSFDNDDLIVDIGGNDGTLLLEFKRKLAALDSSKQFKFVNVECSKSFKDINEKEGITYINEYFGENTKLPEKAYVITSTNVFQHTEPIRYFVKGIYNNLDEQGIWCLEFPYFLSTLITDNYDQAYHEHVYYYFLAPLKELFEQEGLHIINVSYHDIHTGTLRVISVKNTLPIYSDSTVDSFINLEKNIDEKYLNNWGAKIKTNIEYYKSFLATLKTNKKTIAGFGAAIKGCVFLNTCNLDYDTIDYVIDDTPEKRFKYIPGTGIGVVSRDILKTKSLDYRQPDYILILAHNFADYIIQSLKNDGYKGKFIVMFPDIKIID
jgi:C-methyltransferase C-terminal domain